MKTHLSSFFLAILFSACTGNWAYRTDVKVRDSISQKTAQQDFFSNDTVNVQKAHPLGDIRAFGQSILDGKVKPADNNETFACLDSLKSENENTREFFFEVYRVIAQKSDGALGEVVGGYTKAYLQSYPKECIDNFHQMSEQEQSLFIDNLAYEFYASVEDYHNDIDYYFNGLIHTCNQCSANDKKTLENIMVSVKKAVRVLNN
ncbi:hypothetical protein C3K47_00360 [Solitalea longa]|uniref:Lipoprotein n=1 Tax=Solitalea longa TaxID=2079460 RepID=A0A2S5A8S9_9SPHI|nr:hypothetical protein [Solitalea longa]POY38988.1 hypothetical protein C3K47_00360 [Solitalea longa]